MAIRFDEKLNREIDRTIKNFNQKIARLERQERELLPEKVKKKQLKSFDNRKELLKKLKEMQRFTKRGAEEIITTKAGVKIPKYEMEQLKQSLKVQKTKLKKAINMMKIEKPKILGKEQARTFAEMGDPQFLNLLAKYNLLDKKLEDLTEEELKKLKEIIKKLEDTEKYRDNKFKENYIEMLNELGYFVGYDSSKLEEIRAILLNLKTEKFIYLFNTDKAIKAILDYYYIATGKIKGMNPDMIRDDVSMLYDELLNHLKTIND